MNNVYTAEQWRAMALALANALSDVRGNTGNEDYRDVSAKFWEMYDEEDQ